MRRFSFKPFFASLLLCLVMMGGCRQQAQHQDGKITLEFWTLQLMDFKSTLQPMIAAYEKSHPDVKIHWVDVPFSEGEKRALTALMSPQAPDVVNLNPDFSAILANRKALLDMNEMVPEAQRETYLPVAWQAATLNKPVDGKPTAITFGLPWYVTSSVTLYNKNLLQKAGYSKPPEGYEQLTAIAEAVHDKTGKYAVMPVIAERGNFLKELKKLDLPLYDAQGNAVFASGKAAAHLQRYIDLYRRRLIPAEALTEGHASATDRYKSGTLAMLLVGPNFLKIVNENAPAIYKETDVAPQFPQTAGYRDFSLMVLTVPRRSAHPKEAVDFALYMTNARNQLALSKAAPVLPSVTAALRNEYFRKANATDLMERGRSISADQLLKATDAYQIRPGQNAINETIDHYVQLALLGKLDARAALRKAQEEINALR